MSAVSVSISRTTLSAVLAVTLPAGTASAKTDLTAKTIMEKMAEYFRPDNWSLLMVDEERDELYFAIAVGKASEALKNEGIDLEILDLRTVSPLDREAIAQTVKKTSKVIILHEHSRTGGLAGEIAAIINEEAFDDLDGPIVRIAGLDSAIPFSPPLEDATVPTERTVCEAALALCGK